MTKRIGRQTVVFAKPVVIQAAASTVGKKEGEGPLGQYFDEIAEDSMMGEDSWEKAESCFVAENMALVLKKAGLTHEDIQYVLCGDLLNQCMGTTFGSCVSPGRRVRWTELSRKGFAVGAIHYGQPGKTSKSIRDRTATVHY